MSETLCRPVFLARALASLVLGFSLISLSAAESSVTPIIAPIIVNVDDANPPLMYQQDGAARGIYPDMLRTVFEHLRVPIEIHAKPWSRGLSEIDKNLAGLAGLYSNAERRLKYDYSEPIYTERLVVFVPSKEVTNFRGLKSLRGKRVGVIRGWSYGLAFDSARKRRVFDARPNRNDAANFALLSAGRIDALIAVDRAGELELLRGNYKDIAMARDALVEQTAYLAFNKQAKQTALLARFDQTVADLKADGTLGRVINEAIIAAYPLR